MDSEGLLAVADLVERTPPEKFNIALWLDEDPTCGTVACAIGNWCLANPDDDLKLLAGTPILGDLDGFDAVAIRFGITFDEATYLFYDYYEFGQEPSPEVVASRIRNFVKERQ